MSQKKFNLYIPFGDLDADKHEITAFLEKKGSYYCLFPENNLFPSFQVKKIKVLLEMFISENIDYHILTHSPYISVYLNYVMYQNYIREIGGETWADHHVFERFKDCPKVDYRAIQVYEIQKDFSLKSLKETEDDYLMNRDPLDQEFDKFSIWHECLYALKGKILRKNA